MIAAVVAEWQSCRPGAGRLTDELMAQADAEERQTPDQLPRYGDGGLELRRVTRSVGKNNAVRAAGEDPVEVAVVRQDLDLHPARAQGSQRVPLDAVIDDDDSQPRPLAEDAGGQRGIEGLHDVAEPFRHLPDQVLFFEPGDAVDPPAQRRQLLARIDAPPPGARPTYGPLHMRSVQAAHVVKAVAVELVRERL